MNFLIRLCLFLSVGLFYFLAQAQQQEPVKNLILFISQTEGSAEYNIGEAKQASNTFRSFQKIFTRQSESLSFRFVQVGDLWELPARMQEIVQVNERVAGVVFNGHGNQESYSLTAKIRYNADHLAVVMHRSLADVQLHDRLLFYFLACSCGKVDGNPTNKSNITKGFLEKFAYHSRENNRIKEVHAIGHQDFAVAGRDSFGQGFSSFQHLFYKSGLPQVLYNFEMRIFKNFGRSALNNSAISEGLILASIVGVAAGLTFGESPESVIRTMFAVNFAVFPLTQIIVSVVTRIRRAYATMFSTVVSGGTRQQGVSSAYDLISKAIGDISAAYCAKVY